MLEHPAVTVFFCSLINLIKSDNTNITSVKLLSLFIKLLLQTEAGILPELLPSPAAVSSVWEFMVGSEAQKSSAGRVCYKRGYLALFLVEHMRPILERLWCSVRKLERLTRGRKLHYVGRGWIRGECSLAV